MFFEIYFFIKIYSHMFLTGSSLNYDIIEKYRWREFSFFLEKISSCAGLVASRLKRISQLKAHLEINERSLTWSLALSFLSLTMLEIDVSSANTFALRFNHFGWSLMSIKKRRGLNKGFWWKPAWISIHEAIYPFKTTLWNLFERKLPINL